MSRGKRWQDLGRYGMVGPLLVLEPVVVDSKARYSTEMKTKRRLITKIRDHEHKLISYIEDQAVTCMADRIFLQSYAIGRLLD
jgi:hypothetical protein